MSGSSATTVSVTPTAGPSTFTDSGAGQTGAAGNGAAFYSSFTSNPSTITFESANASVGSFVTATSTTSVDIGIMNSGTAAVLPKLNSTITAGALGLYLANATGSCGGSGLFTSGDAFGGCGQVKTGTFQDLRQSGDINQSVAGASFEFKVTAGGTTVYDLTGTESLFISDGGGLQTSFQEALTVNGVSEDPTGVLAGLSESMPGPADTADGQLWNASPVSIGLGGPLAAGGMEDVVYSASVSTFSDEGCATTDLSECLVPYASFGDPIGRGGGTNIAPAFRFAPDFGPLGDPSGGINFVDNWAPESFPFPTFDFNTGVLNFNGGVPEPETWMSMILGFGLIGAALRRRRVLGYT